MNLIREIKQYQAPDGTCFNTKEEAEEYAELLKNPQFIKTQERIEKLENEVRELRAEIIAHKNKIESDYYDMRNALEQHENNKERLFSWLQAMSHEDSARGQFARETLNYAEQKD